MPWLDRVLWSNSRQSWEERGAAVMLIAAAAMVFWFGRHLDLLFQVVLWGLLVLLAALLLRRGWLKLFGPVLFYELVRISRRDRFVWVRFGYACLLFLFLAWTYGNSEMWAVMRNSTPREQAAELAENYFQTFMIVQLLAVSLLTPAYVAGAIADEKEKRTIEFMFATDLRNREIVLSKLGARLANITLFLLTGLPMLSFVQFLGGVDPNLVLAGFIATGMTMLGLAGISIYFSVLCRKPRDAIAMTYLMALAYVGLSLFLLAAPPTWPWLATPIWFGETPPTVSDLVDVFHAGNLFYVLGHVGDAMYRGTLSTVVPTMLRNYTIFQGIVALAAIAWATLRLRAIALKQQSTPRRSLDRWLAWWRPAVADSAMHWKEVFVEGGARIGVFGYILVAIVLVMTLIPGYVVLYQHFFEPAAAGNNAFFGFERQINFWVRWSGTIVGCLLLLSVAVRASTAITSERERQTLDTLLTTPLDSSTMLHAKWVGCLTTVRLGWIWLGLMWFPAILVGGLHVVGFFLVVLAWFVFAGVCAVIGLWFSMVCRTSLQATIATVAVLLAITIGPWFVVAMFAAFLSLAGTHEALEVLAKIVAGVNPPAVLAILAFMAEDFEVQHMETPELIGFCLVGMVVWTVAGFTLWFGAAAPLFRSITRRQDYFRPERRRQRRLPPIEEAV